jgi:hypothetical protein
MVRPEIAGRRPTADSADTVAELSECYLTGPEVKQRYSVSEMWLNGCGSVGAMRRSNVRRAKGTCCL